MTSLVFHSQSRNPSEPGFPCHSLESLAKRPLDALRTFVEQRNYAGYDPYDALNSPFAPVMTFGCKWGRIALIQALRRCPINLRPLLRIPPGHNPKAIALFLEGYARLYRIEAAPEYLDRINYLMGILESTRSPNCSGNGWGYNFDWQSRAFYAPRHTPSIVVSSFVGHALLDTHETTRQQRALQLAGPIAEFLLRDLNRIKSQPGVCFSYTPLDSYCVHNANMLGASLLIRLAEHTKSCTLRDAALDAMEFTVSRQNEDGSWPYAEKSGATWVDSFHTGFVLEAMRWFLKVGAATPAVQSAYTRGVRYYAARFFLEDGTPKYYHDRIYPIDIHAPAEAIAFFAQEGPDWKDLTRLVLTWMLAHMRDEDGYFYFRRSPRIVNRIAYMRWSQAWAFRALTRCL